jgi:hypothetical protein
MSDENTTTAADTLSEPAAKPEKKRQMTFTVKDDGAIRAEFGEGVEPVEMSPTSLPEALAAAALTEGVISRLRGYTSKLTDKDRTPEALRAAVAKGVENLLKGIWKIERAPGEGTPDYSIEVEAAHLFKTMRAAAKGEQFTATIAETADAFNALDDEQKKKLKALSKYQLAYAEVKAARAAAKLEKMKKDADEEGDEVGF